MRLLLFSPCCSCFVALSFVCLSCLQHKISVYRRFYRDKGINYSWYCTIAINKPNNYFCAPLPYNPAHNILPHSVNVSSIISLSVMITHLLSLVSHFCRHYLCPTHSFARHFNLQLLVLRSCVTHFCTQHLIVQKYDVQK